MLPSTVDMTAADLSAELSALGPALPPLLRPEFENELAVVRREAARSGDLTSTRVLLAKWRGVAAAEQKDPGISHRVLAEAAQFLNRES
ncbi:DUF6247 family protein [Kutzneria sp. 744]|uniref:DUF6247 family protein n=1 Tax=Kutzneria sp. (strain 744) TaxID=345341 RepID=UPI0003EEC73B|nr:DUF6247 family protein [Kutzneria sp. 744]EWM19455.1 hypothetical protein KUTG_09759 [Kutzneria sp. 744]